MTGGRVVLVGGGVRSGKSRFAVDLALKRGERRVFIATAQAFDDEMADRIARHRVERAEAFETVEAPTDLVAALWLRPHAEVVLIDCLTLWLSNLLLRGDTEADIAVEVGRLAEAVARRRSHVVIVTNEVGMGIVPESRLGRVFRDVAGRAHQRLAQEADEIYFAVLGAIVRLRPSADEVPPGSTS